VENDIVGGEIHPTPRGLGTCGLASRQHGVVTLSQLADLGLKRSAARARVAQGRLHRIHQGVFVVGHPLLSIEGRWLAAVLACGPGAVLSHRAAAALHGLRPSSRTAIDVTAPRRTGRARTGIEVHRGDTLQAADRTVVRGIPCTSVARTLLDLAEVTNRRGVERACDQAEVLRLLNVRAVEDVLHRAPGRRGATALAAVMAAHRIGETVTRNELEERVLRICDAAALPRPEVNVMLATADGYPEVDFLWRECGLIAETDGYGSHGTRWAFERDRARDRALTVAGFRVVRFTWRQVTNGPGEVAATLRALLG